MSFSTEDSGRPSGIVRRPAFGAAWLTLLERLYASPEAVSPRGLRCREITNVNLVIEDATRNVFVNPIRNLSYRFMVAEWLWIWFGRDDVKTIAQYNRHIGAFSDNGVDFNGAYGIPLVAQWPRVVELLKKDPDSRQAVIQIYRTPAGPTKDVPCTLSLQFLVRGGRLNVIANMRSSDIWLGLPYDAFNFSMLGNILAAQLGVPRLGYLAFNLGSSHLYESNFEKAEQILEDPTTELLTSPLLPSTPPVWLEHVLTDRVPMGLNVTPWNRYSRVLLATSNVEALRIMR